MARKEPYALVRLDGETIGMSRLELWEFLSGLGPVADSYDKCDDSRIRSIRLFPGQHHIHLGCLVLAVHSLAFANEGNWLFYLDRPDGGFVLDLAEVARFVCWWQE